MPADRGLARQEETKFMIEELTEVQRLRRKLRDAVRVLVIHVEAHPETQPSPERLRLLIKCEELERQLDRLDNAAIKEVFD